jgi:iron(III) transport system substrate-binding protein
MATACVGASSEVKRMSCSVRVQVSAVLLFCCALATISTSRAQEITVYNAQHRSLTAEWVKGFTRDTGIKVTVRNGDDVELGNQLLQEGSASPADVFLTENSPAMSMVDQAKLLAPVDAATLAQVAPPYRPSSGHWVGIAARSTVFVYNKTKPVASALPHSLLDLADPACKGRWAASPTGADFQAIVSALLELKGEAATLAWLKAMKTYSIAYRGNGAVLKAVNSGQIEAGVIYHYYYFRDQAKTGENSDNAAIYYFKGQDPGAFVSISGGGVLASSKHQAEAQSFLKWVTGHSGQAVLRDGDAYEYVVGEGQASNAKLVPLSELDAPQVDDSNLNSKKVVDLMTEAGLL